jgi:murein DD-endopeptidase MepM/ murein hydrolase activator NlpD
MAVRTPHTSEEQDTAHDRSQAYYDAKFNNLTRDLSNQENEAVPDTLDDHPINSGDASGKSGDLSGGASKNLDAVKDAEENPMNSSYSGGKQAVKGISKGKKKGLLGALIGGTGAAGIVMALIFGGPSLVGIHAKEALSDFFSDRASVLQSRRDRILAVKLKESTTGVCTVKALCKYRGMKDSMITKLEERGVKVNKGAKILGKTSVKSLDFPDGKGGYVNVKAAELSAYVRAHPDASSAMDEVYKSKFMVWSDKVSAKVRAKFNLSKVKNLAGDTKEKIKESFRKIVVSNESPAGARVTSNDDAKTEEEKAKEKSKLDVSQEIQQQADAKRTSVLAGKPVVQTPSVSGMVAKSAVEGGIKGVLTPLAAVDTACSAYGLIKTVGYGAKVLASAQLIRYAHVIMNSWDVVKAGDATPVEAAFAGDMITSTDSEGKSPTDSFGYKYVAYGDIGAAEDTFKYKVGGGMSGALIGIATGLNKVLGGSPDATCGFIKSPWGTASLIFTGILGAVVGVSTGGGSLAAQAAVGGAVGILFGVAMSIATPMLIDLAAGTLVTGDEVGPDVMNAAVSGMGAYNAQLAQAGGLAPLTKDEVVAYQAYNNATIAAINKNATTNQFDIYNKDSFSGKIASAVTPTISQLSQPASLLMTVAKAPMSAFSSLIRPAGAVTDPSAQYKVCSDEDYASMQLAADPFCNVRYGVNPAILGNDKYEPEAVAQWMYDNKMIDDNGEPLSDSFKEFIKVCIDRDSPIGSTTEDQPNNGDICLQTNPNEQYTYFRLYYIDSTVLSGMDDEPLLASEDSTTTPDTTSGEQGDGVAGKTHTWPIKVAASISRCFLPVNDIDHYGIDIAVPEGTPVYASNGGTVTQAGLVPGLSNFGYAVFIDHGNGTWSEYDHNSSVTVKVGDKVSQGQQIAVSGNTGNSFGAHLHWQIDSIKPPLYPRGNTIDPLSVTPVPENQTMPAGKGCHR